MKILHIGNSTISYSRFIDLVKDDRLTKLYLLTDGKDCLYEKILKSCSEDEQFQFNSNKIVRIPYDLGICYSVLEKLCNYSIKFNLRSRLIRAFLKANTLIIDSFFSIKSFKILSQIIIDEEIEVIWSGSNNFDNSNLLTWFISKKCSLPIVRSYKETNGAFMLDEFKSLKASKGLIFPNPTTYDHFKVLYKQVDFDAKKILFADEDYRYSGLITAIRKYDLVNLKYSRIDNEPHIVILTGRATYGKNDSFTNNRYNYLNLIHEFTNKKIHVHLHYGFIFDSDRRSVIEHMINPYHEFSLQNRYFHLEDKLNLETKIDDYLVLSKYDAGILHNYEPLDAISTFSNFNVPNRLFEYQIANVKPIIIRDTMKEVESILADTNFGLIGCDYSDVAKKLYQNIGSTDLIDESHLNSYERFVDVLFKCSKTVSSNVCFEA